VNTTDRARRAWTRALDAHLRAAAAHENAAELFRYLRRDSLVELERGRAAAERAAYADALRRFPEWAPQSAEVEG
jgi:hypothetical protein